MKVIFRRVCFCVVLLCYPICVESVSQQRHYSKHRICDVHDRIERRCMEFMGHTRSKLECAAKCAKNEMSVGYSVNGTLCFNHFMCAGLNQCLQEDHDSIYYHKQTVSPCFNGGTWKADLGRCMCSDGWIQQFCETRAKGCRELYDWGYSYKILIVYLDIPNSLQEWKVVCNRDHNYINTNIFAHQARISYNRTWNEYENGFFDDASQRHPSFFIGLRPMYLLHKAGLKELVVSILFSDGTLSRMSGGVQVMTDFKIRDANKLYEIDFASIRLSEYGDMKASLRQSDCMTLSKKSKFSTWDQNNSGGANHAFASGVGWWFPAAGSTCNYLGKRCRTVPNIGQECIQVDGIDNTFIVNNFRLTRLFFREIV